MKKITFLLINLVLCSALYAQQMPLEQIRAGNGQFPNSPSEERPVIAPAQSDSNEAVKAKKQQERDMWDALQKSRPQTISKNHFNFTPGPEKLAELEKGACETCPADEDLQTRLLGVQESVDVLVNLSHELPESNTLGIGQAAKAGDGSYVWATSITSDNATGLRIKFTDFNLGNDSMMFIYNEYGQVFGPYLETGPNKNGTFWSHTIHGEQVWIQLHVFAGAKTDSVSFNLDAITHMGPDFKPGHHDVMGKADCNANLDCVENGQCYSDDQKIRAQRKAAAYLIYVDEYDGKTYGCSGSTLNDDNPAHRKAWLMTAAHCIDSEAEADSLEARFRYRSDCGSCSSSYSQAILGADLHAYGSDADFALLELSGLPGGWGLLGWNPNEVRLNDGMTLRVISHPKHSPQSYSIHEIDSQKWAGEKWVYNYPTLGTLEGVSSGASYCQGAGLLVAVHRGGTWTGSTAPDYCAVPDTWRFKGGALSYFWKSVQPYLTSGTQNNYKMHVSNYQSTVEFRNFGWVALYRRIATITIADELGNRIPNVTVTADISPDPYGTYTGVTDDNGQVVLRSSYGSPSFPNEFCVTNLQHAYFNTYDQASNVGTCTN